VAAGLEVDVVRVASAVELGEVRALQGVRRVQGHVLAVPVDATTFCERHLGELVPA
jgi:hypothetical protein